MSVAERLARASVASSSRATSTAHAQPLDKVSFGTNWVAQGEHGGFYQALADGTYRKHGLDVTIVPGGPNVNNRILLPVGKIDFFMSANTLQSFDAVEQNVPIVPVAAMFQKDPLVLLAHPDQGIEKLEDLKAADAVHRARGLRDLFPVAQVRLRLRREAGEALHLQSAAVPRRQAQRDAGLRHLGAVRDRAAGRLQAEACSCSPTRASIPIRR